MSAINSNSLSHTQTIASLFAAMLAPGDCVLLLGDVGAGKTTFTRSVIHALGNTEEVVSPTFTLVQPYAIQLPDNRTCTLNHFDLYRLEDPSELEALGLDELLESGISFIEWPEIAQGYLPSDALILRFTAGTLAHERTLCADASPQWNTRIQQWENAIAQQSTRT